MFDYILIRSARRTLSVSVTQDGKVTVRAPKRMPIAEIEEFVLSKTAWIQRILNKYSTLGEQNKQIVAYEQVLVNGSSKRLCLGKSNAVSDDEINAKTLSDLKKIFIDNFSEDFLAYFNSVCVRYGFAPTGVTYKKYKAKWGCCDVHGRIVFNYVLLMLPKDLQNYVAVHELCHLKVFNHSKRFWQLVERVLPDYKVLRFRLKSYSYLTRLY